MPKEGVSWGVVWGVRHSAKTSNGCRPVADAAVSTLNPKLLRPKTLKPLNPFARRSRRKLRPRRDVVTQFDDRCTKLAAAAKQCRAPIRHIVIIINITIIIIIRIIGIRYRFYRALGLRVWGLGFSRRLRADTGVVWHVSAWLMWSDRNCCLGWFCGVKLSTRLPYCNR